MQVYDNLFSSSVTTLASDNVMQMQVYWWEWAILAAVVAGLILFDLFGHVRNSHEPTLKEAGFWTACYVSIAIIFGAILYYRHNGTFALEYLGGYITEYSLSLDNIFVFIIIIATFRIPRKYQQKVLLYGIVIALILRFVFILLGAALIENFIWVFFIFGLWMLYTAISQLIEGVKKQRGEIEEKEIGDNLLTRIVSKWFPVTKDFHHSKLTVKLDGKRWITPMALCITAIGSIDLMFALDSIPAIFSLTKQPFIVFAANAFALLGLRQLYFLVDGILDRLVFINFGLAAILGFIAYKLMVHAAHGYNLLHFLPEPEPEPSVMIIGIIVAVTVATSIIYSLSKQTSATRKQIQEMEEKDLAEREIEAK